jgi:AcrR family transcriptional regulator
VAPAPRSCRKRPKSSGEIDTQTSGPRGRYHHGGLREALIEAALRLIEETRLEKFSVADAARAAGVSSGAPYRHFSDREDLLDHVAAAGFALLQDETEAAWSRHPDGSVDGLIAGGCAYIAFSARRPELFHLMWGAARPHGGDSVAAESGAGCHAGFIRRLTMVLEAQGLGHLDPIQVATPLWAMVQGYASLLIGRNPKLDGGEDGVRAQVDRATRAYFAGLRATEAARTA